MCPKTRPCPKSPYPRAVGIVENSLAQKCAGARLKKNCFWANSRGTVKTRLDATRYDSKNSEANAGEWKTFGLGRGRRQASRASGMLFEVTAHDGGGVFAEGVYAPAHLARARSRYPAFIYNVASGPRLRV
jgi:hypothetical protein